MLWQSDPNLIHQWLEKFTYISGLTNAHPDRDFFKKKASLAYLANDQNQSQKEVILGSSFSVLTCSDGLVVFFIFFFFYNVVVIPWFVSVDVVLQIVLSLTSLHFLIHVPSLILQLSCAKLLLWDPFHLTSYTTGEKERLAWVRWLIFYRKILLTISIPSLSQWFIFPCSISSTIQGPPLQIIMLFCCAWCTVSLVSPIGWPSSLNLVQLNWWV